jgi:hypothetical protein
VAYSDFSAGSAGNATGGAISLTITCNVGDIIIAHLYLESDTNSWASAPGGYTLLRTEIVTGKFRHDVYYKVASPREPKTPSWTPTTNAFRTLIIAVYTGAANITGPNVVDASSGANSSTAVAESSQTAPSVTTTVPDDMLLYLYNNFGAVSPTAAAQAAPNLRVVLGGSMLSQALQSSVGATGVTYAVGQGSQIYAASHVALASDLNIGIALAYKAASNGASASSVSVTFPASSVNDLAIILFSVRGGTGNTITAPTGWSSALTPRQDNGTTLSTIAFYKLLDGVETTAAFTAGNNKYAYIITIWHKADSTSPINQVSSSNPTAAGGSISVSGVTTTYNNCEAMYFAVEATNTAPSTSGGSLVLESLGTTTTNTGGATSNIGMNGGYLFQAIAGATGAQTFTNVAVAASGYCIAISSQQIPVLNKLPNTLVRM